jgi:hypothetical protein
MVLRESHGSDERILQKLGHSETRGADGRDPRSMNKGSCEFVKLSNSMEC